MPGRRARLLILIVAYNAARTIDQVLGRIPAEVLSQHDCEVLVLDDQSSDETFQIASRFQSACKLTVLYNPQNQGYGGNQKIGYDYAILQGFDCVVLLHGDGQYAPEVMQSLIDPILQGRAEMVMGSRMLRPLGALKGGMPPYKFVGNRILSLVQNLLLGTRLSEFHSGYRAYSVERLARLPFRNNTNDFHFDTQIIIQHVLSGARIVEVPIPTYYGDEICHVNGLQYAWNVLKSTLHSMVQRTGVLYSRAYDVEPPGEKYPLKLGYRSSHSLALEEVPEGARVLDVGSGSGFGALLRKKGCRVTGVDQVEPPNAPEVFEAFHTVDLNDGRLPVSPDDYDYILLLDILEHLDLAAQRRLLEDVRHRSRSRKPRVVLSTGNVAYLAVRLSLLFGNFNYGPRGILDFTHRHLYTYQSFRREVRDSGFEILQVRGIPAPFPEAVGHNLLSRILLWANQRAIDWLPGVFSYQVMITAVPTPTVHQLLEVAQQCAAGLREGAAQGSDGCGAPAP